MCSRAAPNGRAFLTLHANEYFSSIKNINQNKEKNKKKKIRKSEKIKRKSEYMADKNILIAKHVTLQFISACT